MNRVMPKAGYYVSKFDNNRIVYSTGTTRGNKYWCATYHAGQGWMTLLWTCVPGKEAIQDYTHQTEPPTGVPKV
jgi:hypothetical protein